MRKELEEELGFPWGEVHFAGDGGIIRMRPQDVERDTAQDRKVFWAVILACSGVVLVEDDIELPMELIFYAPMRARDFEHAFGRKALGQVHIMHRLGQLAIRMSLGLDAADGGEAGEGGRCRGV